MCPIHYGISFHSYQKTARYHICQFTNMFEAEAKAEGKEMSMTVDEMVPATAGVQRSQHIAEVIDRAVHEQHLVGVVVLVARDGRLLLRRAAGFADRERGLPMREDTIFRLSSVTKPIVTATALALIEQGKLGLDDPVVRWLPAFRPKMVDGSEPAIAIRHLLTHTAGLTYGIFQPPNGAYESAGVSDGLDQPGLSMDEELKRLAMVPLSYAPGSAWGYSLAMDVLGEITSRAGGAPLPELVEQLVTRPLAMADTGFAVRDLDRLAVPYVDGATPRLMQDPDIVPFGDGAGIRYSPSRIFDARSFPSGGAGMVGTATDFMKFLEAVRQGGAPVLSTDRARAMMTNQTGELRIDVEPTPAWGFGFGGAVLLDPDLAGTPQAAGTWKWGGVYGHHWYVDPVNRLTVVALSNTAIEGMAGKFVGGLMHAVYSVLP
jgi:CubicO group peptidase (beta-lactamase class C family)